jgi:ethanolamine utilization cobalamin adenosyltransferase
MVNLKLKDLLSFQIHRNIVNLYKRYLNLIEDLQEEHVNMLNKLNSKIDQQTLKNVDYFDENKYNYIRKKILDLGNETAREIDKALEFIENKNEK